MPKPKPPRAPITYRHAGVDIDAGSALVTAIKPLAKTTWRPGAAADLGGFGALFDLKGTNFKDPLLVAATDGVGTKLKIAIESGRHDRIGIDLVAMCVNDLLAQGAEPLFFLDYFACGALDAAVAERVITGIAMGCREAGCALIGGETAEMPGLYAARDYDLAGFAVGAVERGNVLPRPDIAPGDVLIGVLSSGVHSNAFALVRKLIADSGLLWTDPAPFEPEQTLGEALLVPTRIYVRSVLPLLGDPGGIKAIAHITGGGLSENVPRVLPAGLAATIDLSCWRAQPVFGWLKRAGRLTTAEILRTFNCGIGLVIVAAPQKAHQLCTLLDVRGEAAIPIGEIVEGGRSGAKKIQAKGAGEAEAVHYAGRMKFN